MNRLLIFIFIFPLFTFGQPAKLPSKEELVKIYSQAIADFIKAANKKNKTHFDTLFFGKRTNGEPDDFPKITLPKTIEKTEIILISPEAGAKKQKERASRIYINLIGWVNKENAEFLFVIFSNGFAPQYDYSIHYTYNSKQKEFELEKIDYKEPYFGK